MEPVVMDVSSGAGEILVHNSEQLLLALGRAARRAGAARIFPPLLESFARSSSPTYDHLLQEQIRQAVSKRGRGDLRAPQRRDDLASGLSLCQRRGSDPWLKPNSPCTAWCRTIQRRSSRRMAVDEPGMD